MNRSRGHLTRFVDVRSSLVWIKVVVVGNVGVGKTSIIKRFCEDKFCPVYQPTVGVDYGFKIHKSSEGLEYRIHLWDLSGAPEYLDVRNELYASADLILLVFDVTDLNSFENLLQWLQEVKKFGPSDASLCIVANKMDQRDINKKCISTSDINKWTSSQKLSYIETSCSLGDGVDKLFTSQIQTVIKKKNLKSGIQRHNS